MLSFLVFKGDRTATERPLRHAHLVGPDAVPVAGEIAFEHGRIVCTKTSGDAVGLSLQIYLDQAELDDLADNGCADPVNGSPLRPLGHLTLQTCLLPERDRPYLLALELARHRLMLFLNKLEEWQLFDLPADHPAISLFEAARSAFTQALVAQRDPSSNGHETFSPRGSRLAVRALWLALDASERLTIEAAAREFAPRVSGELYVQASERSPMSDPGAQRQAAPVYSGQRAGLILPGRPVIGACASPASFTGEAQRAAINALDFIQMPMRWVDLEPSEGSYDFRGADQWIEWAVRRAKLPVFAGPVIDFRPTSIPDWLYIWENDYETLRDLVYEHIKNVVTRYRRTVGRWTILSGVHCNDNFHLSFDQIMDLTRVCVMVVRKLHPTAKVVIELTRPWGEYHTENRRSLPPVLFAEMVTQAGILVDAFSVRLQVGAPAGGLSARDVMALSAILDRVAALDRPISVTLGAPATPLAAPPDAEQLEPGAWRGPWTDQRQADWAVAAAAVALAKPFVQTVCWQEISDLGGPPEMPSGGMITADGAPKPLLARFLELREAVRAGRLPALLTPALLGDEQTAPTTAV